MKKQRNTSYVPTMEERNTVYYVHNDKAISDNINKLDQVQDLEEKIRLLEELIQNLTKEQEVAMAEEIAKKGISEEQLKQEEIKKQEEVKEEKQINIKDIDHYKLHNGLEVYSFIDSNGVRKVVENNHMGDLNNQLSGDMLEIDEIEKNNKPVGMIQIDEFLSNPENFRGLDQFQMENIKKIIENKDALNIKFINKDNMLAIDQTGKVLEAYYDDTEKTSKISTPNSYNYQNETLDASSNVASVETNDVELKAGEDAKEEDYLSQEEKEAVKAEIEDKNINVTYEDAVKNIPMYYEAPMQLEEDLKNGTLDETTKAFYEDMSSMHANNKAKANTNDLTKKQTLVYTMPTNNNVSSDQKGIASMFIAAMVLFVAAAIILFIMN